MLLPRRLVIFDTEFTAWQGSAERKWSESWEFREVIQLSAVKLIWNGYLYENEQTFDELVTPKINPILSDYIVNLTGIKQTTLDECGLNFAEALTLLHQFCSDGKTSVYSWGNDIGVLHENCMLNHCTMPSFEKGFVNLRQVILENNIEGGNLASGEIAQHFGYYVKGHSHNALHDVKSITLGLNEWVKRQLLTVE